MRNNNISRLQIYDVTATQAWLIRERLRNAKKNLCQNVLSLSRCLKRGSPKYQVGVLTTRLQRAIDLNINVGTKLISIIRTTGKPLKKKRII
jgi:hypothetical protein